jgi:hypothetical protein
MNLFSSGLFFLLAVIEAIAIFYLVLLGMAPGVKPLEKFTGFFMYGPGLGFFWLVICWIFAIVFQVGSYFLKTKRQKLIWNRLSWAALLLLFVLECVMMTDFHGLF